MTFILDLIILGIIILCAFIGYKQGLIKVAVKLIATLVAIIVALTLYKPVSNLIIKNTNIDEQIQSTITSKILPESSSSDDINSNEIDTSSLPDLIISSSENTVKSIATTISTKIIELVVIIVLYFIAKLVLRFITVIADLLAKLPILKQINKIGGTVYGILRGFLIVFVIFAIISLCSPMIGESFIADINSSFIGSILYNNNLLLKIIF